MSQLIQKVCRVCGQDVQGKKRTKDAAGNYYCQPCYDAHANPQRDIERDAADQHTCSACSGVFAVEQVYETDGVIVCHGCWQAYSAQQQVVEDPSDWTAPQPEEQAVGEWFACPICKSQVTAARMDGSGVCSDCAAQSSRRASQRSRREPAPRVSNATKIVFSAVALVIVMSTAIALWRRNEQEHRDPVIVAQDGPRRTAQVAAPVAPTVPANEEKSQKRSESRLSGSAWVRFADGRLESLRGISLKLLPASARREVYGRQLDVLLKDLAKQEELLVGQGRISGRSRSRDPVMARMEATEAENREGLIDLLRKTISVLKDQRNSADVQTDRLFDAVRSANTFQEISLRLLAGNLSDPEFARSSSAYAQVAKDACWPAIVGELNFQSLQADENGRFDLAIEPGRYVVYASLRTKASIIEWALPISVKVDESVRLNLENDNARITNYTTD